MSYSRVVRWSEIELLGKVPDSEVARQVGCTVDAVKLARRRRGVPAFYATRTKAADLTDPRALAKMLSIRLPRLGGPAAQLTPTAWVVLLYLSTGAANVAQMVEDLQLPLATLHGHLERELEAGRLERGNGFDHRQTFYKVTAKAERLLRSATIFRSGIGEPSGQTSKKLLDDDLAAE